MCNCITSLCMQPQLPHRQAGKAHNEHLQLLWSPRQIPAPLEQMGGRITPDLVMNVFWAPVHLWVCKAPLGQAAWHWEASVSLLLINFITFPNPSSWPVVRCERGVQNAHMPPSCLIRKALGWHFPLWGKKHQATLERCHSWTNPCRQSAHTFCMAGLGFRALIRALLGAQLPSPWGICSCGCWLSEPLSPEQEHPWSSALDWFFALQFPEVWEWFEFYPKFLCFNAWKMYLKEAHILKMLLYRNVSFIMFPLTLECF